MVCEFNQDSDNPGAKNAIGELWRGSCTDSSWGSAQCPKMCYELGSDWHHDGPQFIKSCGQQNYCCQEPNTNLSCCALQSYFQLQTAKVQTIIPLHAAAASASSSSSSSARSTSSSSTSTSSTSTTASSSTAVTGAVASSTRSPAPSPDHSDGSSNSTNKGLAAGLGLVLGLAVVGGALFGLYKWDQRRRMKNKGFMMHGIDSPQPSSNNPTLLIETQGYTEWEMASHANRHEAPSISGHEPERLNNRF
ncbi:MAG: hypothetical protein L6R37_003062 [Teloschistes peruensis]|nr:MAG: hypothetical protein L6R37_003062 [Teloschistes peruensis]